MDYPIDLTVHQDIKLRRQCVRTILTHKTLGVGTITVLTLANLLHPCIFLSKNLACICLLFSVIPKYSTGSYCSRGFLMWYTCPLVDAQRFDVQSVSCHLFHLYRVFRSKERCQGGSLYHQLCSTLPPMIIEAFEGEKLHFQYTIIGK